MFNNIVDLANHMHRRKVEAAMSGDLMALTEANGDHQKIMALKSAFETLLKG